MVLAHLVTRWKPHWPAAATLGVGAVLLFVAPAVLPEAPFVYKEIPAVLLVAAVLWLEPWIGKSMPNGLVFLGAASYSLYLFHPLVAPGVPMVLNSLGIVVAPLSIVLSVLVALAASAVLYVGVEQPTTRWLTVKVRHAGTLRAGARHAQHTWPDPRLKMPKGTSAHSLARHAQGRRPGLNRFWPR
jgi:peptidoglycan/LPS O-acetylase OafA/YrhL